jgi:hypothetical protein
MCFYTQHENAVIKINTRADQLFKTPPVRIKIKLHYRQILYNVNIFLNNILHYVVLNTAILCNVHSHSLMYLLTTVNLASLDFNKCKRKREIERSRKGNLLVPMTKMYSVLGHISLRLAMHRPHVKIAPQSLHKREVFCEQKVCEVQHNVL